MGFYRRRLPHCHPQGRPLFLTWRLRGSLPPERFFPAGNFSSGKSFVTMDRLLDHARTGPLYLTRPEIASLVVEAIRNGRDTLDHYDLHAFVVMANHVHLLITPKVAVPRLLQRLKGTTACRANQMLRLTGRAFWQEETYDQGESRASRAEARRGLKAAPQSQQRSAIRKTDNGVGNVHG